MRILIVDDERIARSELKFLLKEAQQDITILEADSVESALGLLDNVSIDGAFLDMQLPDGTGLDIGKHIVDNMEGCIPIVFSTAYEHYAIDAFSVSAIDYVMKPFRKVEVMRALGRMTKKQPLAPLAMGPNEKLTVSSHDKVIVLNIPDICYITPVERHSVVFTKRGEFTTHQSLDVLEERLKNYGFMRVQRSYIVNLNMINEIVPWFNNTVGIKLSGFSNQVIPVSRQKVSQLKSIFEF
jgi:DNA-binding LytR/AlgR family response regulator